MAELLLELFSEEIPARMQARAAEDLQRLVTEKLKAAGLVYTSARSFVTPRRLALVVDGLPTHSADEKKEEKGPKVGSPQQAVDGFLKKYGLNSLDQCEQRDTGKGVFYFAVIEKKGSTTDAALPQIIIDSIVALPWAKSMRFGAQTFRWVRPFHSIIALFDGKALQGELATGEGSAVRFGDATQGHRFLAPGKIAVANFADYQAKLRAAKVILDQAERRALIAKASAEAATKLGLTVKPDEALLDEVTGLVEWPVVLTGKIDAEFMSVPAEVLTTTMRVNQKYFALNDNSGKLAPHFLLVSNLEAKDGGKAIVAGNERVLRARLSDAKFFWEQDQKAKLADRLPALDGITYHAKLGSVGQKVKRVRALAHEIGRFIYRDGRMTDVQLALVDSAANLCKADLVSGMVGEFPELQGVMGRYYANRENLPDAVADAIADHYKPLGPNDACPKAPVSIAVALADKIDSLVGFFAIDERPTGSKDPFALRRAALGVIRLILENLLRLNLRPLLQLAYKNYGHFPGSPRTLAEPDTLDMLMDFFADRLKVVLKEQGVRHDLVAAVFALGDDDLVRVRDRAEALKLILKHDDFVNLLILSRRSANIVAKEEKKDGQSFSGDVEQSLLEAVEEKALFDAIRAAQRETRMNMESEAFVNVMQDLVKLRTPVDAFFDKVTVNVEKPELRANRLRLVSTIPALLSSVADFSKIEG